MGDPFTRLTMAVADRYRLERELGQGGMATVYLAQDLKHDRKVAIKVLRPELAAVIGAERFLREIKTIANLQHPHILGLIDSGEAQGTAWYVMPFVEGESLRDRLTREKLLPIPDAVRLATEVASALDYAHRHGVIHRDIKPENILLHDGRALVADFGIALAVSQAGGSRMTETGLSLGTPQYMSPEQAMGEREITAGSDIYALGCVTYEMLAGEPPFTGPSVQAIIAKMMTEKPTPPSRVRDTVPEAVEDAVLTALAKLPADRWKTAAEFATALGGQADRRTGGRTTDRPPPARPPVRPSALLVVLAVTLALAAWGWLRPHPETPGTAIRFALTLAPGTAVSSLIGNPLAISPDGQVVAFSGRSGSGPSQIFVRRMNELAEHAVPGTEGGEQPFFSPDSKWLGFYANRQLRKVALAGGPPISIADLPGFFYGASWGTGDRIVVSRGNHLVQVPAAGGAATPLSPDDTITSRLLYYPKILPDGKTVVVTRWEGTAVTARLWLATIGKGQARDLQLSGTYPVGLVDGHLVYATLGGALMAAPFDLGRGRVTGPAVRVLDGVSLMTSGAAQADLAGTGSLVYESGALLSQLVFMDLRGEARSVIPDRRSFIFPRVSPDGSRIAVGLESQGTMDVWVYDLRARTLSRLTTEGSINDRPEWSHDGTRLFFRSNRSGESALWTESADGTGTAVMVLSDPTRKVWEGIPTPDGRSIIYRTGTLGTADIWIRSVTGDTTPRALVATPFTEWAARPSPDGRWVAYASDESGEFQVYVIALPGSGGRHQVSTDGGTDPVWSPDGTRIFYRRGTDRFVATVTTTPEFMVVRRDSLFSGDFGSWIGHAGYDVAPDGKQLLLLRPVTDSTRTIVVHNWEAELRARLAAPGSP